MIGCAITSPGHCLIRKTSIPQLWKENILKNNGSDDLLLWLLMLEENKKDLQRSMKRFIVIFILIVMFQITIKQL